MSYHIKQYQKGDVIFHGGDSSDCAYIIEEGQVEIYVESSETIIDILSEGELFGEMGEEWYDLIRYDYADGFGSGFQVSDIKPTATNSDKFILPFDEKNLAAGNNIVVQNPGY